MSKKNPLTLAGIESATFRFVAQHLNHCATAVPKGVQRCGNYWELDQDCMESGPQHPSRNAITNHKLVGCIVPGVIVQTDNTLGASTEAFYDK